MRTLIRSTIVAGIYDAPELMVKNIQTLDKAGIVPEIREERVIWDVVRGFYRVHQHAPELPTVEAELTKTHDLASLDYLAQMSRDPVKVRGDFHTFLEREIDARRKAAFNTALKTAAAVANTGLEVDKKILRGTDDALETLRAAMRALQRPPAGEKLSGYIHEDVGEMAAAYDRAKNNPATGNFCGLQQIDTTIRGSKNKELWIHAGYSSHLKSIFALNWAYHLATFMNTSVVFFSLEMTYEQVRTQIAAMHSYHFHFRGVRFALGLQADEHADAGLDYEKIRDGKLSVREEEFYKQYVLPDLPDERNRYGWLRIEAKDAQKKVTTVEDLDARAEELYNEHPFQQVFVDHTLLMDPKGKHNDTPAKIYEICKDMRSFARDFRGGQGVAVTLLHQINRDGYDKALKNKELGKQPRYDMTHLSQSSGVEQNADIVTTSWLDNDLRKMNRAMFDCLKSRDQAPFDPFYAAVQWPCRRVLTCNTPFVEVPASSSVAGKRRKPPAGLGSEIFDVGAI